MREINRHALASLFAACLAAISSIGLAEEPAFSVGLPVVCAIGSACFVQNTVDRDPGPGIGDFECGRLSYNGHDGVDIRVVDLPAMQEGVPVVAIADGTVLRLRDGLADTGAGDKPDENTACGNGLIIDHGGGWQSQLCHLRQGSVTVKPGDKLRKGDPLGLVGMSGEAAFPHVHLTIRKDGAVVDPFVGPGAGPGCEIERKPIWSSEAAAALAGPLTRVMEVGFTTAGTDNRALMAGGVRKETIAAGDPALVFFAQVIALRQGDVQTLRIEGPDGRIFANQTQVATAAKVLNTQFIGRKNSSGTLASGVYKGTFELDRGGKRIAQAQATVRVP